MIRKRSVRLAVRVFALAYMLLTPVTAHADPSDSLAWKGQVCQTYYDGPRSSQFCSLTNEHDFTKDRQGMLRWPIPVGDAESVYVDYVRLYRDGVISKSVNPDAWYAVCDTCSNYVSTPWDTACGLHLWQSLARFKIQWTYSGNVSQFYTLWSNTYQASTC